MIQGTILLAVVMMMMMTTTHSQPTAMPNYPSSFTNRVLSGYLSTASTLRSLHYVFIQHADGQANTKPITLWMNGGPGCSSKLGLLQQIGPYILPEGQPYNTSSSFLLTPNPYSWLTLSNLLFIDTPAGVGLSLNNDSSYIHSDPATATDTYAALLYFYTAVAPQYLSQNLYIAGESYAGKYIPDLALKIKEGNVGKENPLKLQGVLIGNGIIGWQELAEREVEFMIKRDYIDPKVLSYWSSCKRDPESAGCMFFLERYEDLLLRVNPYNIYGTCWDKNQQSQQSFIRKIAKSMASMKTISGGSNPESSSSLKSCSYDKGVQDYFSLNAKTAFFANRTDFTVCSDSINQNYKVDPLGSSRQILSLISQSVRVTLFNGDWDAVVPFDDTLSNIHRMGFSQQGPMKPWILKDDNQHAGWIRKYDRGLMFITVKGAGHQVPMYERKRAYKLFEGFLFEQF